MENNKEAPGIYVMKQLFGDDIEARSKKRGGCGCLITVLLAVIILLML
jgi:hypothetical protein